MSPPLPKRGRVRLHVGYPISYGGHVIHGGQKKSSRGSEKRNERNSFYSPPLVGKSYGEDTVLWLEEIKARAGARTQLERYTPRSHTATVTHHGFIYRFHFPRAKAMWSKFSNQRMETSLPPSSVRVHMDGGWWAQRESQLRIHSFIRKEYTPSWRERHVRIPDHLCVWLKLKKEPEFPRNKKRIQSSGSDAREEEVRAWKHEVSFNRLATDYCILLYFNCKLGWACFLLFIFCFYSSLLTIIPFSQ